MDFTLKIVTKLPLESLWNEKESVDARKQGPVTAANIKELLPAVQFVVADSGMPFGGSRPRTLLNFGKRK